MAFERVQTLVRELCDSNKWPDTQVWPFGSYALGTDIDSSDIDCVCVSQNITRSDFFLGFKSFLGTQNIAAVYIEARVSLLQFTVCGREIDMAFAHVPPGLPLDVNNLTDELLGQLDAESVYSLAGVRVAIACRSIIQPQTMWSDFVAMLRHAKLWCVHRRLYQSRMGYLGGIHLTILIARYLQEPDSGKWPRDSLEAFARYYAAWPWPRPVRICPYYRKGPLSHMTYNPEEIPGHRKHVMPILTPAYPFTNIAANMTESAFSRIMHELSNFKTSALALNQAVASICSGPAFGIRIRRNPGADTSKSGYIESLIPKLVRLLEQHVGIQYAHAFVQDPDWIIALQLRPTKPGQINIAPIVEQWTDQADVPATCTIEKFACSKKRKLAQE